MAHFFSTVFFFFFFGGFSILQLFSPHPFVPFQPPRSCLRIFLRVARIFSVGTGKKFLFLLFKKSGGRTGGGGKFSKWMKLLFSLFPLFLLSFFFYPPFSILCSAGFFSLDWKAGAQNKNFIKWMGFLSLSLSAPLFPLFPFPFLLFFPFSPPFQYLPRPAPPKIPGFLRATPHQTEGFRPVFFMDGKKAGGGNRFGAVFGAVVRVMVWVIT